MDENKKKRPTAKKRVIQNATKQKQNKISKAKVKHSIKSLAVVENNKLAKTDEKELAISNVQKSLDKAARKGAISTGRSNRLKSRLTKKQNL